MLKMNTNIILHLCGFFNSQSFLLQQEARRARGIHLRPSSTNQMWEGEAQGNTGKQHWSQKTEDYSTQQCHLEDFCRPGLGLSTHAADSHDSSLLPLVQDHTWTITVHLAQPFKEGSRKCPRSTYQYLKSMRRILHYLNNLLKILNDGLHSLASVRRASLVLIKPVPPLSLNSLCSCSCLRYSYL